MQSNILFAFLVMAICACGDSSRSTAEEVAPDVTEEIAPDVTVDASGDTAEDGAPDATEPPFEVELEGWTVSAGTPVLADGQVVGSVTFTRNGGAEKRGGGVCLVADLNQAHACATAADCEDLPAPIGGFHYCAAVSGGATRTCWTRPGPAELYCNRSPSRDPGTYLTAAVPSIVGGAPTTWMSYACMAAEANPGGCGSGDATQFVSATSPTLEVTEIAPKQVKLYGVDGNTGDHVGQRFSEPGALLGMCGTLPGGPPSPTFMARLSALDPSLEDAYYAAETYDAVITAALAAQVARDTRGTKVAEQVSAVTTRGDECVTYASCLTAIAAGADIDYDGESGPIELTVAGEPAIARFVLLRFGADNRIDWEAARPFLVGDATRASQTTPTAPAQDVPALGGGLRIGTLLPMSGDLSFLGPGTLAGARLAIADINTAGGVNGLPVELVEGDSGDTNSSLAKETVAAFIAADVDVIIGALSSGVSLSVIAQVIDAGLTMISPANTAEVFTTYPDRDLYFRVTPPDSMQGRAVAELVVGDANRVVGIIALDETYGDTLAESVARELVALGLDPESVVTVRYAWEDLDVSDEVAAMVARDPDALGAIGFDETADLIMALEAVGLGPAR